MSTPEQLFAFQGDRMLEDVARQVATDINQFFSKDRPQREAMQDERVRLARELHDGVLHPHVEIRPPLHCPHAVESDIHRVPRMTPHHQ
jgi:signal transduction histidine kinase